MKKSKKLLTLVSILFVITITGVGIIVNNEKTVQLNKDTLSNIEAYNHNPSNILDNVYKDDNYGLILPFIFDRTGESVSKDYVQSQFEAKGLTPTFSSQIIATGTTITVAENSNRYTIIVFGDVNSDGLVNLVDAQRVVLHHKGVKTLTGIYFTAGNVNNNDSIINLIDAQRIVMLQKSLTNKLVVNEPASLKEIDNEKPVITLNGNNVVTVFLNDTYTDAGATATDNIDGVITSNIITTSNVNTNVVGSYNVTYTVTDMAGNTQTVIRTVNVIDYVTGISVTPVKTEYKYGEDIQLNVEASMKSGNTITVAEYTTNYDKNLLGAQDIVVTYTNGKTVQSDEFTVNVSDYITAIKITKNPTTPTYYLENASIDLTQTDIEVNEVYASGLTQEIDKQNLIVVTPQTVEEGIFEQEVTIGYTTTNTIDDQEDTLTAKYSIIVKKKLANLVIVKEKDSGYAHEEFTYGTITSGQNEEDIDITKLKYEVKVKNEDNTYSVVYDSKNGINDNQTISVNFVEESSRPGEILIKVLAEKIGEYIITPYIGESLDDQNAIVSEGKQAIIYYNPTIANVLFVDENGQEDTEKDLIVRAKQAVEKNLIFYNIYGDIITEVYDGEVQITANGTEIIILDATTKPGTQVKGIQIKGITVTEGQQNIVITVNDGTKNITLGTVTVLPEITKGLNIEVDNISLYTTNPSNQNVVEVDSKYYTLIPVSLVDNQQNETKIRANQIIIGSTATEEKPLSIQYNTDSTALIIKYFDETKQALAGESSEEVGYIGIALGTGYDVTEVQGKKITISYEQDSKVITIQ